MKYQIFSSLFLISAFIFTLPSCKKDECEPASTANAGPDQVVGGTSTTLEAITPDSGSGIWTITSGSGGSITSESSPTSTFTGTAGTTYILNWMVVGCPISEDEIQITFCDAASTANAGPDQSITGTSTTLAATTPTSGTGTWAIVSGAGGNILSLANPISEFTGVVGTSYVLKWTVSGCPSSEDEVQISFNNNPKFLSVDKTTVINGEIITVTGLNFSSNYQGMSQVKAVNQDDVTKEVFLPILSRSATEIKAVMQGTGGGSIGTYKLYYGKRVNDGTATFYESSLIVTVTVPVAGQFSSSSTYLQTNVSPGGNVDFGIKNGSVNTADYTVKLVKYDFETGSSTEYSVAAFNLTPGGYGGSMDQIDFQLANNLTVGNYHVKITYGNSTIIGGWGSYLNVF